MALTHYACQHCGSWILWFDHQQPQHCPTCMDVRNALPDQGFSYLSLQDTDQLTTPYRELMPGLWEFWTEPQLGLGSHGWLLQTEQGNIAFEAAPFYSHKALQQIFALGGIQTLAASHPHGYGALWQLQQVFDPVLHIHKNDLQHTKAFQVNAPIDDVQVLDEHRTLHWLGGHYAGQTALYDAQRRVLFSGDALKVDFEQGEPTALSCHKGFHYQIPLTQDELKHYHHVFSQYPFEHVCTPFEFGPGVSQAKALRLIEHLLSTTSHTQPVSINELAA